MQLLDTEVFDIDDCSRDIISIRELLFGALFTSAGKVVLIRPFCHVTDRSKAMETPLSDGVFKAHS
jgi:hypothetical protein